MSMTNEHKLQVLKKVGEEFNLSYENGNGRHRWFLPYEEQSYGTCVMEMRVGFFITIPTAVYTSLFDENKIAFCSRRSCSLTFNSIDKLKARLEDALRIWKEAKIKLKVKQLEGDFEDGNE